MTQDHSAASAATERAAIVTWLRAQAAAIGEVDVSGMDALAARSVAVTASSYATAADLIEEGAHHA